MIPSIAAGPQSVVRPSSGGAISGLGETFQPHIHTGVGRFRLPLSAPKDRHGLTPNLALSYASGSGNGVAGLGWRLEIPQIGRRTDRGIPLYRDTDEYVLHGTEPLALHEDGFYRPVTEGLFSRVKRYGDAWMLVRRDGTRVVLGRTAAARLADPENPDRIAIWFADELIDPTGVRMAFDYDVAEHETGVMTYLAGVSYGDIGPGDGPLGRTWRYRIELDYEERPDLVSSGRYGFPTTMSMRLNRVVTRVRSEGVYEPTRRSELAYVQAAHSQLSLLEQVQMVGVRPDRAGEPEDVSAPIRFSYSAFEPEERRYEPIVDRLSLGPTSTLSDPRLQIVDLNGDGLPDILEAGRNAQRYWKNLGGGKLDVPTPIDVYPHDAPLDHPGVALADMNGNGRADLLVSGRDGSGFWEVDEHGSWERFIRYDRLPTFELDDPEVQLVDLDGDARIDVLRTGPDSLMYIPNLGEEGWGLPIVRPKPPGLDASFSDREGRLRLADMTGDGLLDLVLVYRNRVDYWQNLGHGRFGKRRTLSGGPALPDPIDPRRLLFADVNGSGCADLVYLDHLETHIFVNRSGVSFSEPIVIRGTPVARVSDARVVDMNASGASGILWSLSRAEHEHPFKYLDLTGGDKPHLLTRIDNGTGLVTEIEYRSSAVDLARDREAGTPWQTSLPFPVHVVGSIRETDHASGSSLLTEYRYHHGVFDGRSREFRGFARVDTTVDPGGSPQSARAWFHPGINLDLSAEYRGVDLDATVNGTANAAPERLPHEQARTLRGAVIREEVYDAASDDIDTAALTRVDVSRPESIAMGPSWFSYPAETVTAVFSGSEEARVRHVQRSVDPDFGRELEMTTVELGRRLPSAAELAAMSVEEQETRQRQAETIRAVRRTSYQLIDAPWPADLPPPGDLSPPLYAIDLPDEIIVSAGAPAAESVVTHRRFAYDARGLRLETASLALASTDLATLYEEKEAEMRAALAARGGYREPGDGSFWVVSERLRYQPLSVAVPVQVITEELDEGGAIVRLEHVDTELQPVRVIRLGGFPTEFTVDRFSNQIARVIDANANELHYRYDGLGQLVAVVEPALHNVNDPTYRLRYQRRFQGPAAPVSRVTEHRATNNRRRMVEYLDGHGEVLVTLENLSGDLYRVTGFSERDSRGRITKLYEPFEQTGDVFPVVAPSEMVPVVTQFNNDNLAIEVERPDGGLHRFEYRPWHQLQWHPSDLDAESRDLARVHAAQYLARYAPSADPAHRDTPVRRQLDARGRTVEVVRHDGQSELRQRFTYDARDQLGSVRLRHGGAEPDLSFGYDRVGRRVRAVHRGGGGRRLFGVSARGLPILQVDAKSAALTSVYDAAGRLLEVFEGQPDVGTRRLGYQYIAFDPASPDHADHQANNRYGPVMTSYDASGRNDFTYDHRGRVASIRQRFWAHIRPRPGLRLDDAEWDAGIELDAPDAAPASVAANYLHPSTVDNDLVAFDDGLITTFAYETGDDVFRTTQPDGVIVEYERDLAGRPLAVRELSPTGTLVHDAVASAEWSPSGALVRRVLGNGATVDLEYDSRSLRLRRHRVTSAGSGLFDFRFAYDPDGNVRRWEDSIIEMPNRVAGYQVPAPGLFDYDAESRLIRSRGSRDPNLPANPDLGGDPIAPDATGVALVGFDHQYAYDEAMNFQRNDDAGAPTVSYKSDGSDLYAGPAAGPAEPRGLGAYRYDANGCLIRSPRHQELRWSASQHLEFVDMGARGHVRFLHAADGRRTVSIVNGAGAVGGFGRQQVALHSAGGFTLLLDKRPTDATATGHILRQVSAAGELVAEFERSASQPPANAVVSYPITDYLGTRLAVLAADGTLVDQTLSLPYGRSSYRRAGAPRHRFALRELEDVTGLVLMGARPYDPVIGRFLSPDLLHLGYRPGEDAVDDTALQDFLRELIDRPATFCPYAYAANNPMRFVDPGGEDAWDAIESILTLVLVMAALGAIGYGLGVLANPDSTAPQAGLIYGLGVGLFHGTKTGQYQVYDLASVGGWISMLADMTWSSPNSVLGYLWMMPASTTGTISAQETKHSGAFFYMNAWTIAGAGATTMGHVVAVKAANIGAGLKSHELDHVTQARIFGPLFVPIHLGNLGINAIIQGVASATGNTLRPPRWAAAPHGQFLFGPGGGADPPWWSWVYYYTLFEYWAYRHNRPAHSP